MLGFYTNRSGVWVGQVSPTEIVGPLKWSREGPPGMLVDLPPYSLVCLLVNLGEPVVVNLRNSASVVA